MLFIYQGIYAENLDGAAIEVLKNIPEDNGYVDYGTSEGITIYADQPKPEYPPESIEADRKHLIALRGEVKGNLYILSRLKTDDTSANAVYVDGVITLARKLRCSEIQYARDCFNRLLGKKYKRAAVSRPDAKSVDAFYGNLSTACEKLEDIAKRLLLIRGAKTAKTPRFYLKRRVDALIIHLSALDGALKIIPPPKRK